MRRTKGFSSNPPTQSDPTPKFVMLAALLFLAAAEAMAQEKSTPRSEEKSMPAPQQTTRRIVVSIPDRKLALIEDGRVMKTYAIAVGASATPSPTGEYKVANRIPDPTWYASGKVVGPGKSNPLGTRWIGLSNKGYGIHGTNAPKSIGKNASHGCIRMRNQDVEELFELVRVGDAVTLHGERTEEIAKIFVATEKPTVKSVPKPAPNTVPVVATGIL